MALNVLHLFTIMHHAFILGENVVSLIFFFHIRKEMFYLTTHSTHFIYGSMASDIW